MGPFTSRHYDERARSILSKQGNWASAATASREEALVNAVLSVVAAIRELKETVCDAPNATE